MHKDSSFKNGCHKFIALYRSIRKFDFQKLSTLFSQLFSKGFFSIHFGAGAKLATITRFEET
jgi:hypothetical protein